MPTSRAARRRGAEHAFAGLGQCALLGGCAALYFGTRHLTEGSTAKATENGYAILDLERRLDMDWEPTFQSVALADHRLTTLANWIYMWGHWPVIITALVLLHHHARAFYTQLRDAMIVSGGMGLIVFASFPVAPPRLLPDDGFTDTVTIWSHSYRVLQPPGFVNQYAAMPSLHVGWNLLVGIVVWRATTRWVLRCLAVASPCLMGFAVVATANHYVLDVVFGSLVALTGYAVLLAYERRRTGRLSPDHPAIAAPSAASPWLRLPRRPRAPVGARPR